mgnify:CR=1 FL=1|jgi:hypothetical protein
MGEEDYQYTFEEVPAFRHVDAEGHGYEAKEEYAEIFASKGNSELAESQSKISKAGYLPPEDLILLSDPRYHEHELIHRLGSRIQGEDPIEGMVPEDAESIISQELAEEYGMSVADTAAYLVDDYSKVAAEIISDSYDDLTDTSVEGEDMIVKFNGDIESESNQEQLKEMVAHYLTEDLTRDPIEMMYGYGINPQTFRKTSRSLEKLDKDSDFDKGDLARRALNHDSVRELQETTRDMEDVNIAERSMLNGQLNDEGFLHLLLRELRNRI